MIASLQPKPGICLKSPPQGATYKKCVSCRAVFAPANFYTLFCEYCKNRKTISLSAFQPNSIVTQPRCDF